MGIKEEDKNLNTNKITFLAKEKNKQNNGKIGISLFLRNAQYIYITI